MCKINRLIKLACLGAAIGLTPHAKAQVTIGSSETPAQGAILQLKNLDKITDGSANATKGLGLPRVSLITRKNDLNKTLGIDEALDNAEHQGLLVYNIAQCLDGTPEAQGIYVWDGSQWISIYNQNENELANGTYKVTDPRDEEVYFARNFGDAGDWMLESLRYIPKAADGYTDYIHSTANNDNKKHYAYVTGRNGSYNPSDATIPNIWEEKWKKYGMLYNWRAATNNENSVSVDQGQKSDGSDPVTTPVRGVCPPNWHIPSDKEFNDLEREIYTRTLEYSNYTQNERDAWPIQDWDARWSYGTSEPGTKWRPASETQAAHGIPMKAICPPASNNYFVEGKSLPLNKGGFNLLIGGLARNNGTDSYGISGYIWTSSRRDSSNLAWYRSYYGNKPGIYRYGYYLYGLFSVRCKKDK